MKWIELTQGKVTRVSDEDFVWLSQWKWYVHRHPRSGAYYAVRNEYLGNYRHTIVSMAREILGLKSGDGLIADHSDMDTLNNQRSNLRIATKEQNQQNRGKSSNNTSGYKGAYRLNNGKYISQICVRGKLHYLGVFLTAKEANAAYTKAAQRMCGEFARAR